MKKLLGTAAVLLAGVCFAFEPSQPNPQTVDGQDTSDSCGLGWSVMDSPTLMGTSVRGSTNSILPPSFSMTLGTSGCEQHGIAKNEYSAVRYAMVNQNSLQSEIAEGSGEFLTGLAEVMGCEGKEVATFSRVAQENYSQITGTSEVGGLQFYKNVKSLVRTNPSLARSCNIG